MRLKVNIFNLTHLIRNRKVLLTNFDKLLEDGKDACLSMSCIECPLSLRSFNDKYSRCYGFNPDDYDYDVNVSEEELLREMRDYVSTCEFGEEIEL